MFYCSHQRAITVIEAFFFIFFKQRKLKYLAGSLTLWKSIPPEAVLGQVSQGVDVEAVGSRIQAVNGPINQASLFWELQEPDHPLDLPSTGQHGNRWAQISKKWKVNKKKKPRNPSEAAHRLHPRLFSLQSLNVAFGWLLMILCWGNRNNFPADSAQTISNLIECVLKVKPVNH